MVEQFNRLKADTLSILDKLLADRQRDGLEDPSAKQTIVDLFHSLERAGVDMINYEDEVTEIGKELEY